MLGSRANAGFKLPPPTPTEARQTLSNIPVFNPASLEVKAQSRVTNLGQEGQPGLYFLVLAGADGGCVNSMLA